MDRLPLLVLLSLFLFQLGCNTIFNPDPAISTALQAYLPESNEPDGERQFTKSVNPGEGVKVRLGTSTALPTNNSSKPSAKLSSWQKIEKELSTSASLADPDRISQTNSIAKQQHRRSISDPASEAPQQHPPAKLIRIYSNQQQPFQKPSAPIPTFPLIQRPIIYNQSIVEQAIEAEQEFNPEAHRQSDISWKDSLEATIAHLHEELKSLNKDSAEAKKLEKSLNILKSVESDSSFVNLVDKLDLLDSALPPHQFNALKKVIEQTDEDQSNLISQLRNAVQTVSQSAALKINNADFCTEVSGFGKFKKFDSQCFNAGDEVLLYCELENFSEDVHSNLDNETVHTSRFDAQIEFIGKTDETNYVKSFADITDQCQTNRKDYYLFFRFQIPNLEPGHHRLQIRIKDKIGQKNATLAKPIPFEVVRQEIKQQSSTD
ncbi:MAG: hypothetical protein VX438_19605 [Planctomycetota bacterium]|nr:hypothetical protein [Planctomycetota bacterium]